MVHTATWQLHEQYEVRGMHFLATSLSSGFARQTRALYDYGALSLLGS